MKHDPVTDPTSLIAYRLANGEGSLHRRKSAHDRAGKIPVGAAGVGFLGLLAAAILLLLRL
jgi:hypothetical protein